MDNKHYSYNQSAGLDPNHFADVTIIMPIRNEAAYIERSLNSVLAQDYPQEFTEVLIVDGMSTDRTREIVKSYQERHANIRLVDNPGRIAPTALNTALRAASGEIIIRVDGHCEIAPDYVSRCVQHLSEEQVDCVGGPIHTIGETYVAQTIALAMSSAFGVGGAAFRVKKDHTALVDTVAFPAYSRQAVSKTGLFDEELVRNQDDEYNYRLRKLGGKILLSADIRSRYYSRGSLSSLWRQYFQYGYWKVRVMQKHPRQMSWRQFAPLVFVLSLLVSVLLSLLFPKTYPLFVLLAGFYSFVNLLASLITAYRAGWRYFPLLPLVYAILHLSYGLGFLAGLIKFANRFPHSNPLSRFS